jgi:actin-related protein
MLQRRKEANEAAAALRSKNSFADLTSTAGGVGGLANLGRGAANIRRYDADQKRKELLGELTEEEKNIASDEATARGISKDSLAVQNTTTASNAQLDAAVTRALQQSMTDRGVALNADQKRALEAQKASMTSADKRAHIESNENIAQYNAKTREIIQNSVNDVTMASARLTAQANATQNKNKAIADIVKKMADIQAKRPKQIADLAVANVVLTGDMDKKAKAAYLAERIKDLDTQMKLAIKPLEIVLAQLKSGVTPVSGSGTTTYNAKGKKIN